MKLTAISRSMMLLGLCATAGMSAQNSYVDALSEIARGSRTLKARTLQTQATENENMTGLNLSNPEVEFAYQWGVQNADKVMLDVSQGFDFATLSGAKRRVAESQNRMAFSELSGERLRIVSEADALMTKAVYLQRLDNVYDSMEKNYNQMLEAAHKAVEKGTMTSVDVNSIRMEMSQIISQRRLEKIELEGTMQMLRGMAGGTDLSWTPVEYMPYTLPSDYAEWSAAAVEKNPAIAVARDATAAADAEITLRKKEGLPEFSLGYTSEMVKDDDHYGVSLGVTLPLWGNKGRVKAAKAAKLAADAALDEARHNNAIDLRMKYQKAKALGETALETAKLCRECDNSKDIKRLYDLGNLSVHEYLSQITPLYEMAIRVVEADYAYQDALASLRGAAAEY